MRRSKTSNRVKVLGISLLGIAVFALGALALLSLGSSSRAPRATSFLEEWWKQGQGNFWFGASLPSPTSDSLALDRLISWRAQPGTLSVYEISELSHFILSKSQQYKVSPVLVLSLIEVESNFRPTAVSHKGAIGLMQLMPETAQQLALAQGMEWRGPAVLEDPKTNVDFGLRYVDYLKRHFQNPEHILAAYNIGPYAVKQKLRDGEEVPRQYYDRVMGTVKDYQNRARFDKARPGLWVKSWL